ncbi:hypothetical protein ACJRO7_011075, partial [Eucalyptus globulus]
QFTGDATNPGSFGRDEGSNGRLNAASQDQRQRQLSDALKVLPACGKPAKTKRSFVVTRKDREHRWSGVTMLQQRLEIEGCCVVSGHWTRGREWILRAVPMISTTTPR